MGYRWIGACTGIFVGMMWWKMCSLETGNNEVTIMAVLLTSFQACVGFWLGKHYEHIQKMAYHDSLTGVLVNRRFFELMHLEVERARRNNYSVTLMVIDLDFFKKYNDCYGHVAGDRILCRFAQLLQKNTGEHDLVGRWGGEEFVILMPHTDTEQGVTIGERIQLNVRKEMPGITASIGLATFPCHASSASDLASRADALMYEAKKKRDCMLTGPIVGET